ncbi:MAG: hypothetical protein ACOYON_02710 [Fimbriimonas sp.]
MIGLAFILLGAFSGQDATLALPETKVSAEVRARTLRRVLNDLSPLVGAPLTTEEQLANLTVLVKCDGRPAREVLSQIAKVVYASWTPKAGGYFLERRPADKQRLAAVGYERRLAAIQKAIRLQQEDLQKNPKFDSKVATALESELATFVKQAETTPELWNDYYQPMRRTTEGRLMGRILTLARPRDLLAVPKGMRWVYSTQPNRMQLPLASKALDFVREYLRENTIYLDAAKAGAERRRETLEDDGEPESNTPSLPPVKVLLIVSNSDDESLLIQLVACDEKGKQVAQSYDLEIPFLDVLDRKPTKERPLITSELTNTLIADYKRTVTAEPDLGETVRNWLLNPEQTDPFGFVASDVVLQLASEQSKPVVAWLRDRGPFLYGAMRTRAMGIQTILDNGLDIQTGREWLEISPQLPDQASDSPLSRNQLGAFLRGAVKDGFWSVQRTISYAKLGGRTLTIEPQIGRLLMPYETAPIAGSEVELFLATLSPDQTNAAMHGGIRVRTLRAGQVELLTRLGYGIEPLITFQWPDDENAELAELAEAFPSYAVEEPTELAPEGLANGLLTLELSTEDIVRTPRRRNPSGVYTTSEVLDPYALAYRQQQSTLTTKYPVQPVDLNQLRPGTRRTLTLKVAINAFAALEGSMSEIQVGPITPFASLPEAFRKEYEKALEEIKKQKPEGSDEKPQRVTRSAPSSPRNSW